ncbi:UNVERIFIED_CONTAM: hypothetical protein Cloal_0726 [Acetivibrio alkalicellulosi]
MRQLIKEDKEELDVQEWIEAVYEDLRCIIEYTEKKFKQRDKGRQYKTDSFDGRRGNGGARKGAGAKPESMKHNINACKTFLNFDIEKRYGISKGGMLETDILVQLINSVVIILSAEIISQKDLQEVFRQMDIQLRIQNRQLRMMQKCLGLKRLHNK